MTAIINMSWTIQTVTSWCGLEQGRTNRLIEIVLPWTDEGYGIVVKTTGRNIRETRKIDEIINERYGGL